MQYSLTIFADTETVREIELSINSNTMKNNQIYDTNLSPSLQTKYKIEKAHQPPTYAAKTLFESMRTTVEAQHVLRYSSVIFERTQSSSQ